MASKFAVDCGTAMPALDSGSVQARRFGFDESAIQEAPTLRRQGMTLGDIAEKLGVDRHTLSRNLKRLGHGQQTLRRQAVTDEQLTEAVRLYRTGLSMATVGERIGMIRGSVFRALINAGVATRDSQARVRA